MIRTAWLWLLAILRLDPKAICVMSKGRGMADDFHDYPDSEEGIPDYFAPMTCKRCGKRFTM